MLYHVMVAVLGVVALTALWVGVQSVVRLVSRLSHGADALACWTCGGEDCGGCAMRAAPQAGEGEQGVDR